MEFVNREAAARSPLAEKLFGVPGVTSVFYGSDFVTVTKDGSDWQHLKPAILGAIMEHYMSGAPLLPDGSVGSDEGCRRGRRVLQRGRRRHGCDHQGPDRNEGAPGGRRRRRRHHVPRFKDGIVYLNMKGSCSGCPSSTATLQHGIQNLLKHFVPDVVESGRYNRRRPCVIVREGGRSGKH